MDLSEGGGRNVPQLPWAMIFLCHLSLSPEGVVAHSSLLWRHRERGQFYFLNVLHVCSRTFSRMFEITFLTVRTSACFPICAGAGPDLRVLHEGRILCCSGTLAALTPGCGGVASALRGQPQFSVGHALWGHGRCHGALMQKGLGP